MTDLLSNFRSGTPQYRQSPFGLTGNDPAQLFADLGQGINPSGFVSNLDNLPANVIINENGITVTDGAITITNAGATVIIDGTSDVFKIAATGTLSDLNLASPNINGFQFVDLPGLGTYTDVPAVLSWGGNGVAGNNRFPVIDGMTSRSILFAATSSGGSPVQRFLGFTAWSYCYAFTNAGILEVDLDHYNVSGVNHSTTQRYYVLVEKGI